MNSATPPFKQNKTKPENFTLEYDPLNEPIGILVQLAKDGEIDPWDIDIVHVTDRFLAKLDRSDIRTSSRALLYASVLLRLKSDVIFPPDPSPDEDADSNEFYINSNEDQLLAFETELNRRLSRKRARGSPKTLDDLINELRSAEQTSNWKQTRQYDTSDSPHGFLRGIQRLDYHDGDQFRLDDEPTEQDVIGTAHVEQMEDLIDQLSAIIDAHYSGNILEVFFDDIVPPGASKISFFLAILFMAHRGEIYLSQDELFGDLKLTNVPT
jgi:segregation and condensation protein A